MRRKEYALGEAGGNGRFWRSGRECGTVSVVAKYVLSVRDRCATIAQSLIGRFAI
jgi:hypothetical protein